MSLFDRLWEKSSVVSSKLAEGRLPCTREHSVLRAHGVVEPINRFGIGQIDLQLAARVPHRRYVVPGRERVHDGTADGAGAADDKNIHGRGERFVQGSNVERQTRRISAPVRPGRRGGDTAPIF
jgi:hypothetical protein